jgi:hypothetical protein
LSHNAIHRESPLPKEVGGVFSKGFLGDGLRGLGSNGVQARDYPDVTVTADAVATVSGLKAKRGRDIWLFGGAELFRSLLGARVVKSSHPKRFDQWRRVYPHPAGTRDAPIRQNCRSETIPNPSANSWDGVGSGTPMPSRKIKSVSPSQKLPLNHNRPLG